MPSLKLGMLVLTPATLKVPRIQPYIVQSLFFIKEAVTTMVGFLL